MFDSPNADSGGASPMTVEEENLLFYGQETQEECYNNSERDTKDEGSNVPETGSEQAIPTEAHQSIYGINIDGRHMELSCPAGMDIKVGLQWRGLSSCIEFNHQQGRG